MDSAGHANNVDILMTPFIMVEKSSRRTVFSGLFMMVYFNWVLRNSIDVGVYLVDAKSF